MGRRKRILSFAALLSVLLAVSVVFASGMIDVSKFSLNGLLSSSTVGTTSSTASVFVDPAAVVKDYTLAPIGSKFMVNLNVSGVTDLFVWQINLTWSRSILNVSRITAGEFLLRTTSVSKTASYQLGFVINSTVNAKGYTGMGESILGGASGISGNGRLVSVEFLVTGYGSTDLSISLTGTLGTTLLNSTGGTLTFTKADGYFRNKLLGDINGDRIVGSADFSILAGAYGSSSGQPAYNREADLNLDGIVGSADFSVLAGNYGKTLP